MKKLRLYQRVGCHLCEDMATHLDALRRDWHFEIERIDVDSDIAHRERYHSRVPVLEDADGNCLSEYFLDLSSVLSYLQSV
jgi:hypothetical protein